jgi:GT2 family glycosyltransferase
MKKISIAICVYNKWNFTKSCLSDLSKLSNDHEIIVVDNGSSDETKHQLDNSKEITYFRSEENKGFAWGSNKGYSLSSAPNVLFLNNDIRVKSNFENWTQPIIDKCSEGLVGPTMGLLDNQLNFVKESNTYLDSPYSYMSGWCLASSKEIWDKLIINNYSGPFSEEFFCYFEDTHTSFLARKLDVKMNVVEIPVVHFGRVSSQQLNTHLLYKKAREIFISKWSHLIKK